VYRISKKIFGKNFAIEGRSDVDLTFSEIDSLPNSGLKVYQTL